MSESSSSRRNAVLIGIAAAALLGGAIWFFTRSSDASSSGYLTETVTIRCDETGSEWEMARGRVEQTLRRTPGEVDLNTGLANPETGRPTGFPVDRSYWQDVLERTNTAKRNATRRGGGG